ncbi:site-2 protease family protein [Candidatus Woesearchaeota archaeon]|nr:site-2 protease family protein [Candidatus Woesearchaeota archaeon]
MFKAILSFLLEYKSILIFYAFIIVLLIIYRKKIEVQAKIIFLIRTKIGLVWMDKYSAKFKEWIILLGYIGVGVGFIGMLLISYTLIKNIYDLITIPSAVSGVSFVLPGINIPGLGVLPFWHWLLSIFFIAVVHEFSHGIVARAHKVEVKNTGVVFFGPIIGAFVEPNENKLLKEKDTVQYSILAAGAFSNILLALVALLLLSFVFAPLQQTMVEPIGFTFDKYYKENLPFAQANITAGTIINGLDNKPTLTFQEFSDSLTCKKPNDRITITTNESKSYTFTLAENPDDKEKPVMGIRNKFQIKEKYTSGTWSLAYYITDAISTFLHWLFILSLGIGLFNLLPLPIVDGGRMVQVFLHKLKGPKNGEKRYRQISLFFLLILILTLILPLILKLF